MLLIDSLSDIQYVRNILTIQYSTTSSFVAEILSLILNSCALFFCGMHACIPKAGGQRMPNND